MVEGSHSSWTPGQPRTCARCGEALRITKDAALWFDVSGRTSWHFACRPAGELTLGDVPDASERLRALERRVAAVERRLAETESAA